MFITKQRDEVDKLLAMPSFASLAEIVKCVQILDAPRRGTMINSRIFTVEKYMHARAADAPMQEVRYNPRTACARAAYKPFAGQ